MIKPDFFSFSSSTKRNIKNLLYSGSILFSTNTTLICSSTYFQHEEDDIALNEQPKQLKILSVDGGGIRGIIPGVFLSRIEELAGKPIAKGFDIMAGTSTGGILTMGLNAGDETGVPLYTADKMVEVYTKHGSEIFQQNFCRKVQSLGGLASYKYNADGLNKITAELLGDLKLSDSITNTLVTAYEIEKDIPYFFKSALAKIDLNRDFYMRDVIRATSAAPVYFQPSQIMNLTGKTFTLIDGGVVLNNPTLAAAIYGKNLFPTILPENYMVVSLGTGTTTRSIPYRDVKNAGGLKWIGKIIPLMMDGASHTVDYQMLHVLPDIEGMKRYFRFQPIIPSDLSEMDNTNPENIKRLQMIAEKGAQHYFNDLMQIIAKKIRKDQKLTHKKIKISKVSSSPRLINEKISIDQLSLNRSSLNQSFFTSPFQNGYIFSSDANNAELDDILPKDEDISIEVSD